MQVYKTFFSNAEKTKRDDFDVPGHFFGCSVAGGGPGAEK